MTGVLAEKQLKVFNSYFLCGVPTSFMFKGRESITSIRRDDAPFQCILRIFHKL